MNFLDEFCTHLSIYTLYSLIRSKFDSITEMLLNLSSLIEEDLEYVKILLRREKLLSADAVVTGYVLLLGFLAAVEIEYFLE